MRLKLASKPILFFDFFGRLVNLLIRSDFLFCMSFSVCSFSFFFVFLRFSRYSLEGNWPWQWPQNPLKPPLFVSNWWPLSRGYQQLLSFVCQRSAFLAMIPEVYLALFLLEISTRFSSLSLSLSRMLCLAAFSFALLST